MRLLARDWSETLGRLAASARRRLVICSPYVGREGTNLLASRFTESFRRRGEVLFITDLSPANICQRSTDPSALCALRETFDQMTIRHLPRLHAKVYIADENAAIVTSANLTAGGLFRNFEFGIQLRGNQIVCGICKDITDYGALGAEVPLNQLRAFCEVANELLGLFERQRRQTRLVTQEFQRSFRSAEDTLIRLRLAGGPIHTVFARTIEYLLRSRGAMTTEQMHPLIQAIHPDLCDDSIDRVIDGKRFGKKWKHAARTAQQQLKKRVIVKYESGLWWLI